MSEKKQKQSRAVMTQKRLNELLVKNGYEPAKKGNKTGCFVHILPKR